MASKLLELGTFEETRDGVSLKFKVTSVPTEIYQDLIDHMVTCFIPREPLCMNSDLKNDPGAVKGMCDVWMEMIKEGNAMVAIAEGNGPLKDRIVGANITYIQSKDDHSEIKDEWNAFKDVYIACMDIVKQANVFEKYGVNKILSAFGLSVHPDYHGYRIGERLLQCREPLCRHLGLKVTGTVFTAGSSQYLSKKVGFKVEFEADYSKFSCDGRIIFKDLPGKIEYNVLAYN